MLLVALALLVALDTLEKQEILDPQVELELLDARDPPVELVLLVALVRLEFEATRELLDALVLLDTLVPQEQLVQLVGQEKLVLLEELDIRGQPV